MKAWDWPRRASDGERGGGTNEDGTYGGDADKRGPVSRPAPGSRPCAGFGGGGDPREGRGRRARAGVGKGEGDRSQQPLGRAGRRSSHAKVSPRGEGKAHPGRRGPTQDAEAPAGTSRQRPEQVFGRRSRDGRHEAGARDEFTRATDRGGDLDRAGDVHEDENSTLEPRQGCNAPLPATGSAGPEDENDRDQATGSIATRKSFTIGRKLARLVRNREPCPHNSAATSWIVPP